VKLKLNFIDFLKCDQLKIICACKKSSTAFYILGLVACYGLVPVFEGSSKTSSAFWLVMENLEWDLTRNTDLIMI
jgi:hypothetical protein